MDSGYFRSLFGCQVWCEIPPGSPLGVQGIFWDPESLLLSVIMSEFRGGCSHSHHFTSQLLTFPNSICLEMFEWHLGFPFEMLVREPGFTTPPPKPTCKLIIRRTWSPKGKDHLSTIDFQVALLVSFRCPTVVPGYAGTSDIPSVEIRFGIFTWKFQSSRSGKKSPSR